MIRSARGTGKKYCTVYTSGHAGSGTCYAVLAYCIVWADDSICWRDVKDWHANLARIKPLPRCHQTCIKEVAFAAWMSDKEFACPDQRRAVSLGQPNKTIMSPYQDSQAWRSNQA